MDLLDNSYYTAAFMSAYLHDVVLNIYSCCMQWIFLVASLYCVTVVIKQLGLAQ